MSSLRGRLGGALGIAALCAALAACLDSRVTTCGDYLCPAGLVCHPSGDGCIHPDRLDCDGQPDFAPCSYPGVANGACYDGVCDPAGCGNGHVDPAEVCDDGNVADGDGCSAACDSLETCGNGVTDLDLGETCDDADLESHDGCSSACATERPTWARADGGTPLAIDRYAVAYDAARGRVVVVVATLAAFDTWEWDGAGWAHVPSTEDDPNAREGVALAYDAARRRVVLFGGLESTTQSGSDTWEWDGVRWRERTPVVSPPPRWDAAMAYDAARGRVVLFGGRKALDGDDTLYADTWEWDGETWTEATPATSPGWRYGHAMAYDPSRGRVVLLGGVTVPGEEMDVWEWDGTQWTAVTAGGAGPMPLHRCAAVPDPAGGGVLVFGGNLGEIYEPYPSTSTWRWDGAAWTDLGVTAPAGAVAASADVARGRVIVVVRSAATPSVWEWTGTTWQDVSPPAVAASARAELGLAYDPVRDRVVLFGGKRPDYSDNGETWEWDGVIWRDVTPASGSPAPRSGHVMAWDAIGERVIMFGGSSAGDVGGTWAWDGTTWTEIVPASASPPPRANAGLAAAGDGTLVLFGGTAVLDVLGDTWVWDGSSWTEMTPASAPSPRAGHAMANGDLLVGVLLFGGMGGLSDTWFWDGATWIEVSSTGDTPAARSQAAIVHLPGGDTYLVGGCRDSQTSCIADTWQWSYSSMAWSLLLLDGPLPPARSGRVMVAAGDEIVLVGGLTFGAQEAEQIETWTLDTRYSLSWSNVSPTLGRPPPRGGAATAYDAVRGEIVLFGGTGETGRTFGDTYTWRGAGWIRHEPAVAPSKRVAAMMAYDSARERVVLFGGLEVIEIIGLNTYRDDTWEWDGVTWTEVTPSGPRPSARLGGAMAYDSARGMIVLHGGNGESGLLGDTWTWDGTTWTELGVAGPSPRNFHAAADDPDRGRVVLFGGLDDEGSSPDDTWEWDGTSWVQVPTADSPEGRFLPAMTYDAASRRILLFGGYNNTALFGDLHAWDGTSWRLLDTTGVEPSARMGTSTVYHAARRQTVCFGGGTAELTGNDETWSLRWDSGAEPETCRFGVDGDHDGLLGCADPDCAGWCIGDGDGVCNEALETCHLSPGDCGACPEVCGDFLCDGGENATVCPGDCP